LTVFRPGLDEPLAAAVRLLAARFQQQVQRGGLPLPDGNGHDRHCPAPPDLVGCALVGIPRGCP